MTEADIRRKVLEQVDRSSQSIVAKQIGCSRSYLSDYLAGKRDAGAMIQNYLGVVRRITYHKGKLNGSS